MRHLLTWILAAGLLVGAAVVGVQKFGPAVARSRRATSDAGLPPPIRRQPPPPPLAVSCPPSLHNLTPLPPVALSADNVEQLFPAFHHAPFATAGFNPLALPFRYQDPDNVGDPAEANALAFLLSDALDWAPGNYCNRHAYFVFSESGPEMAALAHRYNPAVIARQIAGWSATHAVGGVLTRTKAGCTGTLEVYAADGRLEYQKRYPNPTTYFDLLGDMAVDAIAHFGPPPSPELAAYLHQPRCQHPESIVRLGLAAFQPRQGEQTFGLFAQILQDDPAFAEVRYWWANQRYWVQQETAELVRQAGQSLHDRITPSALWVFDPAGCRDPKLVDDYPALLDRAEQLAGPDAPILLRARLHSNAGRQWFDADVYRRSLAAAARYPNGQPLVCELARACINTIGGPADVSLAASLAADAVASRFLDATGDDRDAWCTLGAAAARLGRPDVAVAAYGQTGHWETADELILREASLCDAGRFTEAAKLFASAEPLPHDGPSADAARWAVVAALTVGNSAAVAHLREAWAGPFGDDAFATAIDAYAAVAAGQPVDPRSLTALRRALDANLNPRSVQQWTILAVQLDQAVGHEAFRSSCFELLTIQPVLRINWLLCDRYERQHPSPNVGPDFYDMLGWLFPGDPWVRDAVADFRTRSAAGPVHPAAQHLATVRKALSYWSPDDLPVGVPTRVFSARRAVESDARPWAVAAAVHDLLERGDRPAARDLALRFRHLSADVRNNGIGMFASVLLERTAAP